MDGNIIKKHIYITGRKKTHKGGHRQFTSVDDLAVEQEKARKEHEWRVRRFLPV
jgi:hypothetical protein